MDPPFGLKVADWDNDPLSTVDFQSILKGIHYINSADHFHLLCFCEFSMYGKYVKVIWNEFGDKVEHIGPVFLYIKNKYQVGRDLGNFVMTALLVRIGTPVVNLMSIHHIAIFSLLNRWNSWRTLQTKWSTLVKSQLSSSPPLLRCSQQSMMWC